MSDSPETISISLPAGSTLEHRCAEIPCRLGPVRLEREIGRGGMGVVYRGHDDVLDRSVAVKFLSGDSDRLTAREIEAFITGARVAARVKHAGLTVVHHADVVDGLPYLVTEYVDGTTLRQIVNTLGALSVGAVMYAARRITAAVEALHDAGIVHRDIKPSNVLIDEDGGLFVTDFGLSIARSLTSIGPATAGAAGTPIYMAPEVFGGDASPRTDVYALGIMLFEMLTGTPPFVAESIAELQRKHESAPVPLHLLPSQASSTGIGEVVERATYKDLVYRYKSAGKLRQALRAVDCSEAQETAGRLEIVQALAAMCRKTSADSSSPDRDDSSDYYETMSTQATEKRAGRPPAQPRTQVRPERVETAVEMFLRNETRTRKGADVPLLMLNMMFLGMPVGIVYLARRFLPSTPLWLIVLFISLVLLPLMYVYYRVKKGGPRPQPGHCIDCGYDLTGNTSNTCPECGVDRNDVTRLRRCPLCRRRYPRKSTSRVCGKCSFDPAKVDQRSL